MSPPLPVTSLRAKIRSLHAGHVKNSHSILYELINKFIVVAHAPHKTTSTCQVLIHMRSPLHTDPQWWGLVTELFFSSAGPLSDMVT